MSPKCLCDHNDVNRAIFQESVLTRQVITCCGLQSDRVAKMSGCSAEPRVVPFRGEYLILNPSKAHLVNGNIYPVGSHLLY